MREEQALVIIKDTLSLTRILSKKNAKVQNITIYSWYARVSPAFRGWRSCHALSSLFFPVVLRKVSQSSFKILRGAGCDTVWIMDFVHISHRDII